MLTISSVTVAVILACAQRASMFAVRYMLKFQGRLACSGAVSVRRLGVAYQQLVSLLDACASAPRFLLANAASAGSLGVDLCSRHPCIKSSRLMGGRQVHTKLVGTHPSAVRSYC